MSTTLEHPAVRAYLDELRRLLAGATDRDLVVEGVARHIEDALEDVTLDSARVQTVLDELGDPAAIAAEATPHAEPATGSFLDRRAGAGLTAVLLAVGGYVVPLIGWIVGVVLLWNSRGWTLADKLVGTFAPVVVAALAVVSAPMAESTNLLMPLPIHVAVLAGPLLGGVLAATYLLIRFRPHGARASVL